MIELISVHIPKAAGNSVMKVLKAHYGRRLLRLYHDFRPGVDYRRSVRAAPAALALHGHFPLAMFASDYPEARTVVWLRHPVDRLVSYYYYWLKLRRTGNPVHDRFIAGDKSIVGLAELLADEVSGYLGATPVSAIDFIGLVEHIDEDALRLAAWLQSWSGTRPLRRLPGSRTAPHANKNRRKGTVPPQVRAQLEEILSDELRIYREALEVRAERL